MQSTAPTLTQVLTLARNLSTATDWATIEALTTSLDADIKAVTWGALTQVDRDRILALKAAQTPQFNTAQCISDLRMCQLYGAVEAVLEPLTAQQRLDVMAGCDGRLTARIEVLRSNWDEFPAFDYPEGCDLSPFRFWVKMNTPQPQPTVLPVTTAAPRSPRYRWVGGVRQSQCV
jgi:hypothetical protein